MHRTSGQVASIQGGNASGRQSWLVAGGVHSGQWRRARSDIERKRIGCASAVRGVEDVYAHQADVRDVAGCDLSRDVLAVHKMSRARKSVPADFGIRSELRAGDFQRKPGSADVDAR